MSVNKSGAPLKGILKNSSSFEQTDSAQRRGEDIKWDEMNILQTLHPADKDYGFIKIDEPKTPYNYYAEDDHDGKLPLDPEALAKKISLESEMLPKALQENVDESSSDEDETEEMKEKRRAFKMKRSQHYNEFHAVQYARKLIETEGEPDEMEHVDEDMEKEEHK